MVKEYPTLFLTTLLSICSEKIKERHENPWNPLLVQASNSFGTQSRTLENVCPHSVSLAWQSLVETQSKSSFSQNISKVLMCRIPDSSTVYNRGLPRQYDLRDTRRSRVPCSRQHRHPLLLFQPHWKQTVSILLFGETQ